MGLRLPVYLVLGVGVFAVSTGAVLALQTDADPVTKSAWRCGVATLCVAGLGGRRLPAAIAGASREVLGLALLAGLFLAAHFATWLASLDHVPVATSLLLVNTIPVWVVLLAPWVNRDRPSLQQLGGACLALGGATWLTLGAEVTGSDEATRPLFGSLLAVAGALGAAAYFLIGRRIGGRLDLAPYLVLCYGSATLWLILAAVSRGADLAPSSGADLGWLVALGLVPQLVGHTASNYALRRLPALLVSLPLLMEPVVGSLLAWVLMHQNPGPLALRAGVLVLAGVALASLPAGALSLRRSPPSAP